MCSLFVRCTIIYIYTYNNAYIVYIKLRRLIISLRPYSFIPLALFPLYVVYNIARCNNESWKRDRPCVCRTALFHRKQAARRQAPSEQTCTSVPDRTYGRDVQSSSWRLKCFSDMRSALRCRSLACLVRPPIPIYAIYVRCCFREHTHTLHTHSAFAIASEWDKAEAQLLRASLRGRKRMRYRSFWLQILIGFGWLSGWSWASCFYATTK